MTDKTIDSRTLASALFMKHGMLRRQIIDMLCEENLQLVDYMVPDSKDPKWSPSMFALPEHLLLKLAKRFPKMRRRAVDSIIKEKLSKTTFDDQEL